MSLYAGGPTDWRDDIRREWRRLRLHLGSAILGGGWLGVTTRHILIARAARECITPDGQVILARCQPLADALYAEIAGDWTLTVARTVTATPGYGVDPVSGTRTDSRSTPNQAGKSD